MEVNTAGNGGAVIPAWTTTARPQWPVLPLPPAEGMGFDPGSEGGPGTWEAGVGDFPFRMAKEVFSL